MKLLGMNILDGGETINSASSSSWRAQQRKEHRVDTRRRAGIPAGREGVRGQVQDALQPGHRLVHALFLRRRMVIAAAMKAADSTDPARLPALARIKYPGVTADLEFDKNGDLTKGLLTIFEVKNGKWEVVSK
jgi:hypothetical protein